MSKSKRNSINRTSDKSNNRTKIPRITMTTDWIKMGKVLRKIMIIRSHIELIGKEEKLN